MAFTFGFGGDDIDDDEDIVQESATHFEKCNVNNDEQLVLPKLHLLEDLLRHLPSQLSYNSLQITNAAKGSNALIARRSVFDIRTQLMAEANPDDNDHDMLLAGLDRGDLTSGVYEGGFKTWECALDLAGLVADIDIEDGLHVVEIGAGSAIPSLTLLRNILDDASNGLHRRTHFTLCDYNEDVLRLATAPNVFLTQQVTVSEDIRLIGDQDREIEDIDEMKISASLQFLETTKTTFDFISGAWCESFTNLVERSGHAQIANKGKMLILASETIYAPASTKVFTQMLMQLLQRDPANSRAWIAAKKIYFGVGGSIDDFMHEVRNHNGCLRTILDVKGAGVGRVVLEVTANQNSTNSG